MDDHLDVYQYDLESLKNFMEDVVFGIDGLEGINEQDDNSPGRGTVFRYWNVFIRGKFRQDKSLPKLIILSVTNVGSNL